MLKGHTLRSKKEICLQTSAAGPMCPLECLVSVTGAAPENECWPRRSPLSADMRALYLEALRRLAQGGGGQPKTPRGPYSSLQDFSGVSCRAWAGS